MVVEYRSSIHPAIVFFFLANQVISVSRGLCCLIKSMIKEDSPERVFFCSILVCVHVQMHVLTSWSNFGNRFFYRVTYIVALRKRNGVYIRLMQIFYD
jgi:hypothetical protein